MITPQYLAGLIDGEGYLAILPSRAKGLKNPSFEPVVKIGMTGRNSLMLFENLKTIYGGTIELRSQQTKGGRLAYTYTLKSRRRVAYMLSVILPYLLIKKIQAELLAEFCELPNTHSRYSSFDPKVLERKIAMYSEMKVLKQPEPLATTN